MGDGIKLTVRPVKQRRGTNLLMLCDEQGQPLPNQGDLQWTVSNGVPAVTVTFVVDGRNVSLQGEVEVAMRSLGAVRIPAGATTLGRDPAAAADRPGAPGGLGRCG
ncbi:hypothetical protein ACW7BJ_33815 [Azospirillum argentinense]